MMLPMYDLDCIAGKNAQVLWRRSFEKADVVEYVGGTRAGLRNAVDLNHMPARCLNALEAQATVVTQVFIDKAGTPGHVYGDIKY